MDKSTGKIPTMRLLGTISIILLSAVPSATSFCSPLTSSTRIQTYLGSTKKQSEINETNTRNKSKKRQGKKNGNGQVRKSKEDISNLMVSMGLQQPESPSKSQSSKQNKKTNKKETEAKTPSVETQLQFARNGHAVLRNIISPAVIADIKKDLIQYSKQRELDAWQQKVEVALGMTKDEVKEQYATSQSCQDILQEISEDGTVQVPFLQHFHTWRSLPSVKKLVIGETAEKDLERYEIEFPSILVESAKILLDVPHVKLYQDSLFHKRANDGPTPWHSDSRMAPFDTSKMVTFWIPLDFIPSEEEGGTGLLFVDGSHNDFALPFWNGNGRREDENDYEEESEYDRLEERYRGEEGIKDHMPLAVSDVTCHAGFTLHSANGGYESMKERYALAVTYVDARAEIREDAVGMTTNDNDIAYSEDRRSFEDWVRDVRPRSYFEHPSVPTI